MTMTRFSLLFLAALALGPVGCLDPDEPGNLVPRTVVEDPTLPRIEVAGTLLHAEAFGDPTAPTVMVLHGGPGIDYRNLLPLRALAADGYRVVFWDQRGTGLSQRHDKAVYTWERYLEDLRLVIEKTVTPNQPFVFIGHSWGAMYASWFINEHGDYGGRLAGAILSEPGGLTKRQLDAYLERFLGSVPLTGELLNDAAWSGQFMSAADHARADYLSMLLALGGAPSDHLDPSKPSPMWRNGAVVSNALVELTEQQPFDWTTNLKAFAPKVLFLRSGLNSANRLEHQQEMAASYANAEVVTIPGVGHELNWERPEEYLVQTRAYFRDIGFTGVAR
jgi:proline iminopeptidase